MISFQFELIKMSPKESSAGKKREGHLHLHDVDGPLSSSSSERAGGGGGGGENSPAVVRMGSRKLRGCRRRWLGREMAAVF